MNHVKALSPSRFCDTSHPTPDGCAVTMIDAFIPQALAEGFQWLTIIVML
jgi:hypothetical protein